LESKISRTALVTSIATREIGGLIWACLAPNDATPEPVTATEVSGETDTFFIVDTVRATISAAAENFLDGFHTHFVHSGWIRREGERQRVTAEVRQMASAVEACYRGETLQSGLISRLLEGDRTESMGRFRMPGIAELEYRGRKGLNLMVTAWFTPESAERIRIHARISTPRRLAPGWLKQLLLSRIFGVILQQDKAILERTHDNIARFESGYEGEQAPAYLETQLDLLGPSIRRLLRGDTLEESRKTLELLL
jgi:phenylpropionate dioxygenase-like ring-hydroxylating dioxygenase large terminal subunit